MPSILFPALLIGLSLCTLALARAGGDEVRAGMVIETDFTVEPGTYKLASDDLDTPALTVRGEGITVDLSGVTLIGTDDPARPDLFEGLAVRIEGKDITIKGLTARGYKVALMARDVDGLTVKDCDFSYNWRQRLRSTPWKEDLADWMSYHHNEEDEWLRYGAAIYLRGCDDFDIHGNTVTGGQNGLMLTECNDGIVHSNRFSFNSSLGIAMYRSSRNNIQHNRLDFNVRGHSEGIYNRGQDSAAILVFEQCSDNIFAWNSATHSGDGFFLWAGQTTMDTGEGGSNDNLLYENDFSYAPTNGIEATFSRNNFIGNTVRGCWHGLWGGYSYESLILANDFGDNEDGVNIEHGQSNSISYNRFDGCETAIRLYERGAPDDWAYAKVRDTDSRQYVVMLNDFVGNDTALFARNTRRISGFGNTFKNVGRKFDIEPGEFIETTPMLAEGADREGRLKAFRPEEIEGVKLPDPLVEHPPARDAIRVTEWGPYDYRRPILWPEVKNDQSGRTLLVLGPAGEWDVVESTVDRLEWKRGDDGQPVALTLGGDLDETTEVRITFRWTGDEEIIDEFGRPIPAGEPYEWTYSRLAADLPQ